ncbi:MAG: multiheme c-type cytochrome, partial [Myxococcota bacterium]
MTSLRVGALRWWALTFAASAFAADADPRGWSAGQPAAASAMVLAGPAEKPLLAFPKRLTDAVDRPTVVFYFSPTCPHCRKVAAEVEQLSRDLTGAGARLLGVASGSSTEAELLEFRATYGVTFEVLLDADRSIGAALGAQSTPSAMLVSPPADPKKARGSLQVVDVWYPYHPGWDVLVLGRVTGDLWKQFRPDTYVGNNTCAACHSQEHGSWLLTLHAVAWRTLVRGGNDTDPACTRCHVTGAGAPTGWSGAGDDLLVDVGCEACHGPGGPHDGVPADPRAACASCHDPQHSIAFTLDKAVPLVDHYAVNTLSPGEFDARRRALWAGEVDQALLAFPSGANVGSDKCVACHPSEHAWWVNDAHANGMASLRDKGADDPACVRCHATSKVAGPPQPNLDAFDRLGGVGCESCHGPGEQHVAAGGGTTNIQGLGDSCPVCVLDAVCTSCHTLSL